MAQMTREQIAALILARLPDNTARFINPQRMRDVVSAIADSALFLEETPWSSAIGDAIAAAASAFATAAQGAKADSAVQPAAMTAALDAAFDARASITSGSVRAQMMVGSGGTYAGGERATHRQRDRTNVAIDRPWLEFLHGRIISTGVTDQELEAGIASGVPAKYRAAVLTGISGTGKNQTTATVQRATFFGMAGISGCTVSPDGYTITVPNGVRFRSDRFADLSLTAGQEYFVQTECVAADGSVAPNPRGRHCIPTLGDLNHNEAAASAADLVFGANWSSVPNATLTSAFGPIAVLGTGSAPVVIVDGDSIASDLASPGTGANGTDAGDALGVKNFIKRALNAMGYAYVDLSVPGTNVGNLMAGYGLNGLRADLMRYGAAVITDHLHNDRRSGVTFEAVSTWTEASRSAWNSSGLRTRYKWHNDWLRSKLKAGARIVRCTLAPQTNSTDAWATAANQTAKNDDSTWASDYATGTNGDQFKLADLIMRRGLYAGLAHGGVGECDAGFDLYAALGGTADGKWPIDGSASWATGDGTHPSEARQIIAAVALASRLPELLRFGRLGAPH